jgi:hypothetical protein
VSNPETTGVLAKLEELLAAARFPGQNNRTEHLLVSAVSMIQGLMPLLPGPALSQTLLVSLYWMERALRALLANPTLLLLIRLFEVITDEVFLVLQILKPYSELAIRKALKDSLFTRLFPLGSLSINADVFLYSSGMDAISSALTTAISYLATLGIPASVYSLRAENEYVETTYLCEELRVSGTAPIIFAILNPSVPRSLVSVDDLLAACRESLAVYGNCALVLDITIETEVDEIQRLFQGLQDDLDAGRLTVMLCKSYCKYATFGAAKVSGGGLFLFASPALSQLRSELSEFEAAVDWMQQPDAQFLAHMTAPAVIPPTLETRFVQKAAAAAVVAHRIWAATAGLDEMADYQMCSLPFLVRDRQLRLTPLLGRGASLPLGKAAAKMQFEDRDSFASLRTSFLELPTAIRFNIGLEDEGALRELFYAIALLTGPAAPPTLDAALGLAAGTELTAGFEACSPAAQQQVASVLLLACQVWVPPLMGLPGSDSELGRMLTLLIRFLVSQPAAVTVETLDHLRAWWLRLCLCLPPGPSSVPTLLGLLPAYRAAKIWSSSPGDLAGEEAVFLRSLLPHQCCWLATAALKAGQPGKAALCLTYCPRQVVPGLQSAISEALTAASQAEAAAEQRRDSVAALVATVTAALAQPQPAAAVAQAVHDYAVAMGDVDNALGTLASLPLPPLLARLSRTRGLWSPSWPPALVRSAVEKALKA